MDARQDCFLSVFVYIWFNLSPVVGGGKLTATFNLTWKFLIFCDSIIYLSAMTVQLTVEPAVEKYCICIPFFSPKHGDKWDWMTRVRRAAQPNGEAPEKAHTWLVLQFAYGNCCCTFTFRPVGRRFYTKWLATIQGQLGGWVRVWGVLVRDTSTVSQQERALNLCVSLCLQDLNKK